MKTYTYNMYISSHFHGSKIWLFQSFIWLKSFIGFMLALILYILWEFQELTIFIWCYLVVLFLFCRLHSFFWFHELQNALCTTSLKFITSNTRFHTSFCFSFSFLFSSCAQYCFKYIYKSSKLHSVWARLFFTRFWFLL